MIDIGECHGVDLASHFLALGQAYDVKRPRRHVKVDGVAGVDAYLA